MFHSNLVREVDYPLHRHRHQSFHLKIREVHWHIAIEWKRDMHTQTYFVHRQPKQRRHGSITNLLLQLLASLRPSLHVDAHSHSWKCDATILFKFCLFLSQSATSSMTHKKVTKIIWHVRNEKKKIISYSCIGSRIRRSTARAHLLEQTLLN